METKDTLTAKAAAIIGNSVLFTSISLTNYEQTPKSYFFGMASTNFSIAVNSSGSRLAIVYGVGIFRLNKQIISDKL